MANTANLNEKLSNVDEELEAMRKVIEFGEKIEQLHELPLFQEVMIEGYLKGEADRLFTMLTTPTSMKRDSMENMMEMLSAIRHLKQYYHTHLTAMHTAKVQLQDEEEYKQSLQDEAAGVVKTVEVV